MDKSDFVTERRAFVNDEYKTHSQFTENYMTMEGLDFFKNCPEKKIEQAAEAAKRFEEKYNKKGC